MCFNTKSSRDIFQKLLFCVSKKGWFVPLKTHLFYCCRGFNTANKCVYCSRFYVESIALSSYLDNKFTFSNRNFLKDFCPEHFSVKLLWIFIRAEFYLAINTLLCVTTTAVIFESYSMSTLTDRLHCISSIWKFSLLSHLMR